MELLLNLQLLLLMFSFSLERCVLITFLKSFGCNTLQAVSDNKESLKELMIRIEARLEVIGAALISDDAANVSQQR